MPHERLVLLGEIERRDLDVPFYEFGSVLQATENFSDSNKLGRGGFGDVYKVDASISILIKKNEVFPLLI